MSLYLFRVGDENPICERIRNYSQIQVLVADYKIKINLLNFVFT